jgi:hypothetical protein
MATRKQRSRRAKSFRHDYGFVMDDEEGNEVQLTGAEVRGKKDAPEKSKPKADGSKSASRRRGAPQPASWERALKRGLPWGAGVAVILVVLAHGPIILGVIYGLAFVPMMYYMDKFVYRSWERKQAGGNSGKSSGKPGGKTTGKTG